MSKKCGVRSLSDCALAEIANIILSTLSYAKYTLNDVLDVKFTINHYMEQSSATWNIYQDLLRVILSSDYLDANMRFVCLQMLLNERVTYLVTEIFPFSYYEKILKVIAAQGTGLRVLNLKGVWVKEEHMHYLFDIIRNCTQLQKLFVPYIANDDLLEVIGKHSRYLQVLNISGEIDVTEIGVEFLSHGVCNEKLTVIDIGVPGEENICYSDIALLLECCPNVETFSTYSFVGASLKFIHDNVSEQFSCKLKYLHDTDTDENTLRIVAKACPNLESLYLDSPQKGALCALEGIILRKLKLYKFSCSEMMHALESIGQNLSHLTMVKGNGCLDVGKLAYVCPMLIDLDCYMMDVLTYTKDNNSFVRLEGLEILSSPMPSAELKFLICDCKQLKRLAVDSIEFDDEDIISIFVGHDFCELENIWFTLAPNLTILSIEILMDRCPELQSIGQLSGWALTSDDLALLRGILKSGNFCLQLQ